MFKKILLFLSLFIMLPACADNNVWINDLKNLFLSNKAIIYEVNLRTFAANDADGNGIIDFAKGEESGNFINAISRLNELKEAGVNTLHIMPIMALGKTKALGTAGSLYAPLSFDELNPQLKSKKSSLSLENQAIYFINSAHKNGLRVIIDLPSCGSYDLYMKRPELFAKNDSNMVVTPSDWTDVRLFYSGDENNINKDVYDLYKQFVDYVIMLGVDGIRADVATSKPALFWKNLIDYSHTKDPQFLWLAEASESWNEPVAEKAVFTPYSKLLEVGFDGFYGSYFKMKDWRNGYELINYIKSTLNLKNKYGTPKAVIGSFTTHDEMSPVLINGIAYSSMIMWLNATLPLNSYFVDGFSTGDNYIYFWSNKKAPVTYTDDEYYFTHRGKLDIFNFSRRPGGQNSTLSDNFVSANEFKHKMSDVISNGKFVELKTDKKEVFAYSMNYNKTCVLVWGNMNFRNINDVVISIPHYDNERDFPIPVKVKTIPQLSKGKINVKLQPGEIEVFVLENFELH